MLPKLAYTKAFVVDEGQFLALLVDVARHAVEPQGQFAVGYFAGGRGNEQRRPRARYRRVGLCHEEATIVDGYVEGCIALVHGVEELLQAVIEGGAAFIVSELQCWRAPDLQSVRPFRRSAL